MKAVSEQLELIKRGAVEIISEAELEKKLITQKPLRIKAGFDPTASDLHLGHTVLLQKLKHFQDLGHQVIFLIGDFTALIGDPTGRSATRPLLNLEQIRDNAKTYTDQVFKILDKTKTEVRCNSEWLANMNLVQWADLASKQTVARLLERDDFQKRIAEKKEISLLEQFYPLFQAYDSVQLKADVELGGTDQKFNLLMGRTLQSRYNQAPQIVLTLPLLEGTDGVQKMSKSYGNYIGITESPSEMFGKVMRLSDELMWRYYELLSNHSVENIRSFRQKVERGEFHPKEAKMELAREIVARFHSGKEAIAAAENFDKIFKMKEVPEEIEEVVLNSSSEKKALVQLLTEVQLTASNSDAKRMIAQDAVSLNGSKVSDIKLEIEMRGEYLLKVGKRKFKKVKFV